MLQVKIAGCYKWKLPDVTRENCRMLQVKIAGCYKWKLPDVTRENCRMLQVKIAGCYKWKLPDVTSEKINGKCVIILVKWLFGHLVPTLQWCQDSLVSVMTKLRTGWPAFDSVRGQCFFFYSLNSYRLASHAASCTVCSMGRSCKDKLAIEAENSPVCNADIMNM